MKQIILLTTLSFCFSTLIYAQPGNLDASFGTNGIVKTDLGLTYNYGGNAKKVLVQSDGSIYIITDRGANLSAILKLHPDGSADLSYGNNGSSALITMTVNSGAMQADGKIIIAGGSGIYFALARFNSNGTLDHTFGLNGMQKTSFGDDYAYVNAIAIGNDGKIAALGNSVYHYDGTYTRVAMARYTKDGILDTTFNHTGKFLKAFSDYDNALSVAIQPDGKILMTAATSDINQALRFNKDGSIDSTFIIEDAAPVGPIAIQSDGKILIGNFRLNMNGSFDGYFSIDFTISDIAIQTDGKIIAAGYSDSNFVIRRYKPDLSSDNTFGNNGKQVTKVNGAINVANSTAIQSDGKILVGGYSYTINNNQYKIARYVLARYNTNGSLDKAFDGDGKLTGRLVGPNTIYTEIALQKDGNSVAAGNTWNGHNFDFALARYNVDGSLDNTFSADGKQTTDLNTQNNYLKSMAIQSDGKIVVAGIGDYIYPSNSPVIVRYNSDGSLDKSFSGDGIQSSVFEINSIAIQSDGKIVVAGEIATDYPNSFALSRLNPDGSPDNTFGENGTVIFQFNDVFTRTFINSIAIQKDGKIVAAGGGYNDKFPGYYDLAIARYNTNGSIDNTFSDDGFATTVNGNIVGNAVAIQSDGTIVVACNSAINASTAELYAYTKNGDFLKSLQLPFGTDFSDYATSIAVQSNDKIVVAGSSSGNFALARCNKILSLDSSFSKDGVQITNASPGNDGISGIAISGNKLYTAGSGQFPGNYGVVARYLLDDTNQNNPPSVKLILPNNITVYGAPANIFLKATASDIDGTITQVDFYNGNTLLHTERVAPYGFLWKDVPVGSYTLTAKATDNSGVSSTSASVHVMVIVSSTPAVNIISPANNATFTAPASIKIHATATDPAGITKVEFYNGSALLHTEHLAPYDFSFNNVAAGNYILTAKATNNNGVAAASTIHVTVTNNNGVIAMSPDNNKSIADFSNESLSLKLSPNPVHNTLQVTINGKQNKTTELYLLSSAGVVIKNIHSITSSQVSFDVSSLANGVYFIKVISGGKVMYKQFVKL